MLAAAPTPCCTSCAVPLTRTDVWSAVAAAVTHEVQPDDRLSLPWQRHKAWSDHQAAARARRRLQFEAGGGEKEAEAGAQERGGGGGGKTDVGAGGAQAAEEVERKRREEAALAHGYDVRDLPNAPVDYVTSAPHR